MRRRPTRMVRVGSVVIGGDASVSVQSMTNTDTRDVEGTLDQIRYLAIVKADIVRVAVPRANALEAFGDIVRRAPVPIVADVHFDHRLAVEAAKRGAHKIRINPGNIGGRAEVAEVVSAARDHGIPIRVGVNAGSPEEDLLARYGGPTPEALVESAKRNHELLRELGCEDVVVSIKASDVPTLIAANEAFAAETDVPLHLGVTEAGLEADGAVKSAVGIGALLARGIGDTIRVSLTADPAQEVHVGRGILRTLGLITGPELISCPTCARCRIDLQPLAQRVADALTHVEAPIKVAVMGCEVNGPGEAKHAHVGIAGGMGKAVLFRLGEVVQTVPEQDAGDVLLREIETLARQWST
ncbi:MAG: flavodoxin-dependent (E)-4-hydroxy-3-methylbut-2-enyl-diphosphate synthase [Armatimonadota bacterium]